MYAQSTLALENGGNDSSARIRGPARRPRPDREPSRSDDRCDPIGLAASV